MFDLKIVNGQLADGTGRPLYKGDIGITGDRITAIGELGSAPSKTTIDAAGKVVSPGFIDMHTHSDLSVLVDPHASSKIHDGVTTEVIGNCGIGVAPVKPGQEKLLVDYLGTRMIGTIPVEIKLHWSSFAEYLDYINAHSPAVNIAPLLAHGPIRIATMGFSPDHPSLEQMEAMKQLIRDGMEAGALGFSTGLIYMPGEFSTTDELAELTAEIRSKSGFYVTHIRNESQDVFTALEEALTIGQKARTPVHISHLKLCGSSVWGRTDELLGRIDRAVADGIETSFDLYPYTAGMTSLMACLPPWAFEGGVEKLLARLGDSTQRMKMIESIEQGIPGWQNMSKAAGGWQNIMLSTVFTEKNKELEGKTIEELAELLGKDPYSVVFDLLVEERGRIQIVLHMMQEADLQAILRHPLSSIGSDGMSMANKGVLSTGKPHPRAFGTRARVLAKYVREEGLLTVEEAVKKMSYMPAKRLGLKDRGVLAEGNFADLLIFDPAKVSDQATYQDSKQYSVGFDTVIVNGAVALQDGVEQEVFNGRVVTK
ncbi:MAG: D-aminoacylase [Sporomusaceae bacterium]|nr:D-aminoacylase [Sporomusaceae bacterium]